MGMKKCPFCSERIQAKAIKCKHCGEILEKINNESYLLNQNPKRKKKSLSGRTVFFAISATILGCFMLWLQEPTEMAKHDSTNHQQEEINNQESKQQIKVDASDSSSMKIKAWVMAQEFLEDFLKSPSIANYGSFFKGTDQNPEKQVTYLGNNEYSVKGWVDSQNGFGATVRTDFIIKLRHNVDDSWSLLELPTMITR